MEYPRNWHELMTCFPDDGECLRYLERLRRAMGSRVGSAGPWARGGGRWPMVCGAARSAARRRRSQPARSSRARAHPWSDGWGLSGTSSTKGAVSHHQLDYYLDGFMFRFNRRHSRHRSLLFYRLLQGAMATEPHPYRSLTRETAA